ncbi:MAG: hypothetical protein ABI903_05300 [Actinomycetota bacterium]
MTQPHDAATESVFPAPLPIPPEVDPVERGSFAAPAEVEFPAVTEADDAPMSAFGNLVQSDVDPDQLDVNISHVRQVRYVPEQGPRAAIPPEAIIPVPLPSQSVPAAPARARRWRRALVLLAVGIWVVVGVVAVLVLIR